MGSQPRVEVLLATHNGQQFVREQINSLLGQDYANLTVLARDDGSTDRTQDVLKEYALRFPDRFRVLELAGANGGMNNNFLSLMKASTADYVCFSDQDDVWLYPDKVSRTKRMMDNIERTSETHTPLLVFTDLRVVRPKTWRRFIRHFGGIWVSILNGSTISKNCYHTQQ